MAEVERQVTTDPSQEPVATTNEPAATQPVPTQPVATENPHTEHRITMAERLVYLIGGTLIALLGIRLLLKLLGANPSNGFADFIYTITHPFVAPFFGLFDYHETFGRSRFEFETLIAIVVYLLIMVLIAKLVALPSRRER